MRHADTQTQASEGSLPLRSVLVVLVLLVLPLSALALACGDPSDGVHFSFDQPGISPYSESTFCLGTHSDVGIRSYYAADLPPWIAQTSDPFVVSTTRNQDYPDYVELAYLAEGEATLTVQREDSGEELDRFPIRVARPDGLAARSANPAADLEPREGEVLIPVGGPACSVEFNPYRVVNGERTILFGTYDLGIGSHGDGWILNPQGFLEPALVLFAQYTIRFNVLAAASEEGQEEITFTGPEQTQVTVPFRAVAEDTVTGMALQIAPYYREAPRRVGDRATFVAVQQTVHGPLCRGYAVTFTSETPDTLWIRYDGEQLTDNQDFEFLATGVATVTVTVPGRPDLTVTESYDVAP